MAGLEILCLWGLLKGQMSELSTSAEQLAFSGKCRLGFFLNMEFSSVITGLRKSTIRHLLFLPGFIAELNLKWVDLVCWWSSLEVLRAVLALLRTPLQKQLLSWRVQIFLKGERINLDAQHKNRVELISPRGQSRVFWPRPSNNNPFVSHLDDGWWVFDAADFDFMLEKSRPRRWRDVCRHLLIPMNQLNVGLEVCSTAVMQWLTYDPRVETSC